jgi:uncharacterized protein YfaS (alpha-2-macroglobulin family)
MSRPLALRLGLVIIVVVFLSGLGGLTAYYADLPAHVSQHETIVLGQNRFVPGSQATLRVVVRDSKDASPLANAAVKILLRPAAGGSAQTLFTGNTDSQGTANVSFAVPTNGDTNQTLIVETRSSLGSDRVERAVTLDRDYRVLLTTDKPLYQPGQIIHLRALALSAFDLHPAVGQDLQIIIADGKGNKVFRETVKTSDYGVASTDFQLATQVNTGPYKITAQLGNTSSEKTVTVEHYVLPKFTVKLETENSFYLPGAHVRGSLQSDYFFGKPVAGGQVVLEGYTFDVARTSAFKLQGTTDADGAFQFEFDLPTFIAGTDLEGGRGLFFLQANVTDLAQHTETSNLSLPIAQSQLVIEAVPEGGQFRPGVENIFYVLTSYPDGTPAETSVSVQLYNNSTTLTAQTGPYGLAEIRLTPDAPYQQIGIDVQDARGATAHQDFYFEGEYVEETILLRPDRPLYHVGETMNLTILTSQVKGTAYLDVVREGQTVSTRAIPVDGGHAEVAVDLSPDLYGTLELHAYKILTSGNITRDTRLVVVDAAAGLNLTVTPDHPVYRPGESAGLDIQVNGQDGNGAQSAVGLAVVDESVFALAEQDPGFAKLYFLLEQELLEPKYELHGFTVPQLLQQKPVSDPVLQGAQAGAAQASLAETVRAGGKLYSPAFTLQANSHQDAIQRSYEAQQKYFTNVSQGLYGLLLILPLMVMGLSAYAVWRERQLIRSLLLIAVLVPVALILLFIWPLGEDYWWAQTPLDRLSALTDWLTWQGESVVIGLALLGLLGFLALSIIAWIRKERALGWSLALLVLFVPVTVFLAFAASQSNVYPSSAAIGWGLAAFALMPAAFLLRAASFGWNRRIVLAFLTLLVSVSIAVDTFPLMTQAASNGVVPALQRDLRLEAADGLLMGGGAIEEFAVADAMPAATQAAAPPAQPEEQASVSKTSTGQQQEPPRLRQYFPETMLWLPDGVTDPAGHLRVDTPVADSITTWRVTALASTQDGRLGSTTGSLRVFQDFFIDLDLPGSLTVGDEVSVPVGVFNYLQQSQNVRLELEKADWFDLLDESSKEINIAANDITVVYFKIRAKNFGNQPFKVTALGSQMSDAIQKNVRVFPDGKQIFFTQSDRLTAGTPVKASATIPADAIPGTQSLTVKIYPGILSQVVEGLDSMLQMPYGCFEQTSSTNYPNTLVLDYLKSTNQVSPETQLKAEEYINLGYQRLTTFEVNGSGGFSLFGDPPADPMLTAYGLQEFSDMSRVHPVDEALIQRTADWLLSQQQGDGSWVGLEGFHESSLTNQTERLPVTAYIVWSLVDSGFGDDARVEKGLQYLREFQSQAKDAYPLALVANALVAADVNPSAGSGQSGNVSSATEAVLERLADMAVKNGNDVTWSSGVSTFMGSEGQTGDLETTALAALAFLRANSHPDLANAALTTLIKQKDSFGTWYNTQATILTLKALLQSVRAGAENVNANVTVTLNGGQSKTVQVTPENFDVVQLLTFSDVLPGAENVVEINVEGKGNLMYQVSGNYYLPWDKLVLYPEQVKTEELVKIDVAYDRTELAVNEEVNVNVVVTMNEPDGQAEWALIDLGIPPGFAVESADLDGLVTRYNDVPADYALPTIERYELTGRQILVYIKNLSGGNPLKFSYRLKAKYPLVAQTPASMAYDYYNPNASGEVEPQVLTVKS